MKDGSPVTKMKQVFATPWFEVLARTCGADQEDVPYYILKTFDYVVVVGVTVAGDFVLVRQFRPALEQETLEFPAGHVDPGETPEDAARRELLEETGYAASRLELLGSLFPDPGRLANQVWCFLATDLELSKHQSGGESGIEVQLCSREELIQHLTDGTLNHAQNLAALFLAVFSQRLPHLEVT